MSKLTLKEHTKRLRTAMYYIDESLSKCIKKDHRVLVTDLLGEMGYYQQLLETVEAGLSALLEVLKVRPAHNNLKELHY